MTEEIGTSVYWLGRDGLNTIEGGRPKRIAATKVALSRAQRMALETIRDHGPEAWCYGHSRAGGARMRMFQKLADLGYCTVWPPTITDAGRFALGRKRK